MTPIPEPLRDFAVTDEKWLETLYPQRQDNWWLEFRFLEEGSDGGKRPPVAIRFLQDFREIADFLQTHRELSAQRALRLLEDPSGPCPAAQFWGIQPRLGKRGRSEDVAAMVALACDLDCKDWPELPESERPRAVWERIQTAPATPSAVTWTGHGFHAYWLLREPYSDKRHCEEVQRAMARCLRGDHVWDCARLLRWPNSVNYKGVQRNQCRTVRLVSWHPGLRYTMTVLAESFQTHGTQTKGEQPDVCPALERVTWKRFYHCLDGDSALKALWEGNPDGLNKRDRSTLDMALAHSLVRNQFSSEAFAALASQAPWNNQKSLDHAYLERTWCKAQDPARQVTCPRTESVQRPALIAAHEATSPGNESASHVDPAPTNNEFLSTLPESAWTQYARLYREAVGASTEAADVLHYIALLTVLGAVLGRNVTVFSGRPIHLNVYAMLIGPTGDRKSTAAELALDLLRRIGPDVLLLNGVGSQEGLMERMAGANTAKGSRTLLFVDEMAALLKKGRRESSGSLLEFITEVFHTPDSKMHYTRAKAIHLVNPTLSILAASTPSWLEAALEEEDILGGFTNRFIYVSGAAKPDNPLPAAPDESKLVRLCDWISQIAKAPPRSMTWCPDARELWCDFYVRWRRFVASQGERSAALLRRIDLYILKFASLNAAMDETAQITPTHLASAIELGRFLAGCAHQTLSDLGAPRDYRIERLIEQKLAVARGSMRRKHLRQALGGRVTGEKLDRILRAMERNGLITQVLDPKERGQSHIVNLIS